MNVTLPQNIIEEFSKTGKSQRPVSFILPFRGGDRLSHLHRCVQNLVNRYPHCEILVIEDGPARIITSPIAGAKYIYTFNKRLFNKAKCFNLGFLIAKNDVICGLDCDMLIPSTLIDTNEKAFDDQKVIFPGRDIYYVADKTNPGLLTEPIWQGKTWLNNRADIQFQGGIFLCNKKAYTLIGGFDHRFEGYGSEDTNFYERARDTKNIFCSQNVTLLHIDHEYNPKEKEAIETNKRLLIYYSRVNPIDRIADCKANNIFRTK